MTLLTRVCLAAALVVGTAHAQSRQECAQASEDAQLLRMKGQLSSARTKLVMCSSAACPKVVRNDCSQWLDEIDRAMPSIVIGARDATGKDLTDVRVSIDGNAVSDWLEGKALPIDPGRHVVRFESQSHEPREETIVVREGEKARLVTTTFGEAPPPVVEHPRQPLPEVVVTPKPVSRAPSAATWVVGGLGLATLAAAGVIGTASLIQRQNLYNSCGQAGMCQQSDVDAVYLMYDLAYGGAALGGALVVTSIILFFATRPSASSASATLHLTPMLGPGGLGVSGRF